MDTISNAFVCSLMVGVRVLETVTLASVSVFVQSKHVLTEKLNLISCTICTYKHDVVGWLR